MPVNFLFNLENGIKKLQFEKKLKHRCQERNWNKTIRYILFVLPIIGSLDFFTSISNLLCFLSGSTTKAGNELSDDESMPELKSGSSDSENETPVRSHSKKFHAETFQTPITETILRRKNGFLCNNNNNNNNNNTPFSYSNILYS